MIDFNKLWLTVQDGVLAHWVKKGPLLCAFLTIKIRLKQTQSHLMYPNQVNIGGSLYGSPGC